MVSSVDHPAEVVVNEELVERPKLGAHGFWSSIFAASVASFGIWLVLHLLGIGIGLTAIDPDDPSSLRAIGIGTGIWSLVAPLIALFIGGLIVGRLAPTWNQMNGAIYGIVVWAVTVVAALVLVGLPLIGGNSLAAAEQAGKLVLVLSITMLVGLAVAAGGAVLAVRRERRKHLSAA